MLKGYGVTHVFHVPAVLRKTFAVMETRTKIKRLHVHGEKTAAYMADGYARASGKPGICMAQVIGALNLAAGLRDAWLAHSPVIAFTGGREPKTKFRKVYQEVDDVPAFEPVTKLNATVDDVTRFPDMVRQAFRVATIGHARPGASAIPRQRGPGRRRGGGDGAAVRAAVRARAAVPAGAGRGERAGGAEAFCRRPQRPVIVAGGGVRASGAQRELVALAEALQIPVATSLNGKDTIPGNHPLSVGVVGTYSRESANRVVNARRSRLLHRHRDRRHDHAFLGGAEDRHAGDPDRHRSGSARPQLSAAGRRQRRRQGDAGAHAGGCRHAQAPASARPGSSEAQKICKEWYAKYKPALESDAVPIRPERICARTHRKHVPDDAIVVVDTGHAGMWMGGMYDLRSPTQSYMRSAGHLGWAFPAGLGAKCGVPGPAGGDVHRRRRLLVSHRRDRDRGALEASTP